MTQNEKKPNFFAGEAALNCLLGKEFDESQEFIDFTVDVIEAPFWLSFRTEEKEQILKVYTQLDLYSKDESMASPIGTFVMDRESKTAKCTAPDSVGNIIPVFYKACRKLSCFIRENNLESLYKGLDPEQSGILLEAKNGELSWKVVSGKERPDLMVQSLFGGITMGRPYMDDFIERSMFEEMSLDEHIEAAEEGDASSMEYLAMAYLNGDEDLDLDPDPEKAVYWLKKLAEAGDPIGMFNLGLHYAKGHGVKRDFKQATYWMEKAAKAGDEDAPKVVEEYKKLAESVDKAAAGDAQAQADLAGGLMKLGGSLDQAGPGEDYAESVKWAEKAAAQNNGDGIWILALAYEHGRGVPKDKNKAVELYKRGAELGHAKSQHSLGAYYMRGEVVKKDQKKAFDLFMKSAEQGYGLAMEAVGTCYQFANGVDGNMKVAIEWYEKALQVMDDPELASKVAVFKQLSEVDENFDKDYPMQEEDATDADLNDSRKKLVETIASVANILDSKYYLTYEKGIRCGDERYSIGIPDGFEIEKNTEDRAFIAWLPDGADDYNEAKVTFFDGKIISENDNDSRLYTPEASAALLENAFWSSPVHSLFQGAKIIPLDKDYPGGIIICTYDLNDVESAFHYNIQLCFKGCTKGMRVLVTDVVEEDIPACDKMVIDWIRTIKLKEPLEVAKKLDDPSFVTAPLTDEKADEWKSCSDALYSIIFSTLDNRVSGRVRKLQACKDRSDSQEDVIRDGQKYVEKAASDYSKFLKNALDGLEAIKRNNEGNPLLQRLYDVILPCITGDDKIECSGVLSAKIPEFEEIKKRFYALKPEGEAVLESEEETAFPELNEDVDEYYKEKKLQFERLRNNWESLSKEAPDKLRNQFRNFRAFESKMHDAKIYIEDLKQRIDVSQKECTVALKEMSHNLNMYVQKGQDFKLLKPLFELFLEWMDHVEGRTLQFTGTTVNFTTDKVLLSARKKWEDYYNTETKKAEAREYGIPVEELEKHKNYLNAKEKMNSVKASSEMADVIKMFSALGNYKDSAELTETCRRKKAEMEEEETAEKRRLAEEDRKREEARRKREEERRRKKEEEEKRKAAEEKARKEREEAERRRREEEERIDNVYKDAVRLAGSSKIKDLQDALRLFEGISDKRDVSNEIVECEDRLKAAEEADAKKKRKMKRTAIIVLIMVVLAVAAYFGVLLKLKSDMTKQLIDSQWYELGDSGIPVDKLDFEDEENATRYNSFDLLENKWSEPYKYNWSYGSFSLAGATINLGDDMTINASKNKDGALELVGENFVGTYITISDDEYNNLIKELAANKRDQLYLELMSAIRARKYDNVDSILQSLGDYKDCKEIKEEWDKFGKVTASLPRDGQYAGGKAFDQALDFINTSKYFKFPEVWEKAVRTVAMFTGKWEYSEGDSKAISYTAKDADRFYEIKTINMEASIEYNTGNFTIHMMFNDGSIGTYIPSGEIDTASNSFKVEKYVGGDVAYSIKDNTLHIDFEGKKDMPSPDHATAEYKKAE